MRHHKRTVRVVAGMKAKAWLEATRENRRPIVMAKRIVAVTRMVVVVDLGRVLGLLVVVDADV